MKFKKRCSFLQADLAPTREHGWENGTRTEPQFLLTWQLAILVQGTTSATVHASLSLCFYVQALGVLQPTAIQYNKVSIWGTDHMWA